MAQSPCNSQQANEYEGCLLSNADLDSLVRRILSNEEIMNDQTASKGSSQESKSYTYIQPRQELNGKLDAFYKSHLRKSEEQQMKSALYDARILVCRKCAGRHNSKHCTSVWRCQVCGAAGHRSFQCARAKCWKCLKLGHMIHHCLK